MDPSDFQHPVVRDLAWLLASPSLVAGGGRAAGSVPDDWLQRAYVERLPWLEACDREHDPLALTRREPLRLGRYAEDLLEAFLRAWPRCGGLTRGLQIREGKRTRGELDLVWLDRHDGVVRHWELAVKFFLHHGTGSDPAEWLGPNPDDRLDRKLALLFGRQLALGAEPATRARVAREIPRARRRPLQSQAILKGYLYEHVDRWADPAIPRGLAADHARGWWCRPSECARIPRRGRDSRWIDLPKAEWLAPAVRPRAAPDLLAHGQLMTHLASHFRSYLRALHLAELRPGLDGRWHEHQRGFVVHRAWPCHITPSRAAAAADVDL